MQKPTGVVIIAVLYWIGALGLLVIGMMMSFGFSAFMAMSKGFVPLLAGFGLVGGIVLLGLGAVFVLIGYGLFALQEWARIVTVVLTGIGFLVAMSGMFWPSVYGLVPRLFRIALDGVIIWYLLQPHVKAAFRRV
jgi:hypothetical protein